MISHNPLFTDNAGDPFIFKDEDDYYIMPTCSNPDLGGHTFQCYHSKDLINWSAPATILDFTRHVKWAKQRAWAPTMVKHDDHYYFCFCADQQIGIAVGESPMGEFRDILGRPLIRFNEYGNQTIDPCLFKDTDGKIYLFFGQGKGYLAEISLSCDDAHLMEEPVCFSDQFYYQRSNTSDFDITVYNESPDIIKIGDRYLLTWSIYDVRDPRYAIRYAWSDNVRGPYIQPVNEQLEADNILMQGRGRIMCTGHGSVTEYKGEYYMFYGRYVLPRGSALRREICFDKLSFLDDDHIRVVPSL